MGKKPMVSVTYENERISIKKQLTLLKMCYVSPVWSTGRFMAVLMFSFKRFSLESIIKNNRIRSSLQQVKPLKPFHSFLFDLN